MSFPSASHLLPKRRDQPPKADLRRPITAWHCCLEFYAVATRLPEEFRLAPKDALQLLEQEVLGRFRVLELDPAARLSFLAAAVQERVAGGRIYDAHIGEVARQAGAKIVVTDNMRHFSSVARQGCRVVDSATFAARLGRELSDGVVTTTDEGFLTLTFVRVDRDWQIVAEHYSYPLGGS